MNEKGRRRAHGASGDNAARRETITDRVHLVVDGRKYQWVARGNDAYI
jgi:hypothetical protein